MIDWQEMNKRKKNGVRSCAGSELGRLAFQVIIDERNEWRQCAEKLQLEERLRRDREYSKLHDENIRLRNELDAWISGKKSNA